MEGKEHVSSWHVEVCGQQQVYLQTQEHKRAYFEVNVCVFKGLIII